MNETLNETILLDWCWSRYVGYKVEVKGLRLGDLHETESDLEENNDLDCVWHKNSTIVCKLEDIEGLERADKFQYVLDEIDTLPFANKFSITHAHMCDMVESLLNSLN